MTTNFSGSSSVSGCATIYTFPPRGRFAIRDRSEEFAAAANVQLPRGVKLVSEMCIRDRLWPRYWENSSF